MTTRNANTSRTYGYCRISTNKQSIERQERNIKSVYPDALIIKEAYTGTKIEGREKFEKLIKSVKPGDKIVFDSVSRMSRNAEEGIRLYQEMYSNGVELVFLKEPYINTETYRSATKNAIPMTGTNVDLILRGVNEYLMVLAEEQIKIAFDQAEKEVKDLRQRTREGLVTAKLEGKQIGRNTGDKLTTKKSVAVKAEIIKLSRDFEGSNTDAEVMKLTGVARNTYYKYKKEISEGR